VAYLLKKRKNPGPSENKPVEPYSVASIYRRNEIIDILNDSNIHETARNGFDQVSFAVSAKFCFHDIYTGFSVTVREPRHNIGVFAGFDIKPAWSRVLVKETDAQFYQYMDKSYLVYGGIMKEIFLTNYAIKGNWLFGGSLAAGYNFGNEFKGTDIKPGSRIRYNKNAFNLQISLEYTNTEFYKIGPVWLRTGISFNLDFKNLRAPLKIIKW
jgi:hypothetical protein